LAQDFAVSATSELFANVSETPAVQSLARRLENGGVLSVETVSQAAQAFFAVLLHRLFPNRPIVVITEGLKAQESFQQDIQTWLQLENFSANNNGRTAFSDPLFYPAWEILPQEARLPHSDVISERLQTLVALADESKLQTAHSRMVVTNVVALLQRTFSAEEIRRRTRLIVKGDQIDPLDLVEWLEEQGYEPEAQVTQKGEIALRGGILDLFPLTSPWPVRIEFFGDEIESLREFDPLTQISKHEIPSVIASPAGELGVLKKQIESQLDRPGTQAQVTSLATLIDYLPSEAILLCCEPQHLAERAEEYRIQVPSADPFFVGWVEFVEQARAKGITVVEATDTFEILAGSGQIADSQSPEGLPPLPHLQSLEAFRPMADRMPEPQVAEAQRREFFSQLHRWSRQGYNVHVFCNNDGERQRFVEIWHEYGLKAAPLMQAEHTSLEHGLSIHLGALSRGFLFDEGKVVVVTDAEIFGRYRVQRPRRLKSPHALATRSALDIDFTELEEGDFVVHLQHGIGRFAGLQVLPIGAGIKTESGTANPNVPQECLVIEYAPTDSSQPSPRLYVPVTEAHLVSKYVGVGKARPVLNTLGGTRWAKTKAHAERAVLDVAGELLSIQAARESQAGHSFAPDTPWQREFEGSFIYEETPHQMQAIIETKADMERPKPMDRLICGDVGFGKTEVGIRAAFKAVMEGKQVAVLVPTTVLAQQHFNTFRERMADYPIRVELLSRFRTRRAQQLVVSDLAAGSVDIVIGTHRLLQGDISFKDLGLVVIDEEQRFGVLHKEKFKMLRKLVDVLTLSATPIPRTLYLALTGARDMSTIQTPPHDRLPVETIVTQYDERIIRDAIQREMNRSGQVFFLHNRVMTIDSISQKLQTLVPNAKILVGHGQMHSDELEEVMTKFVNGEADVLLSTTIIESGLDIPNANTIIIDRADRFGLSDLYQLRGRVGRYKHQAYAYLLLPRHGALVADVRKRISAIKQYSTLGSGFKIAMRDLEIRGAGNLLGSEQSGHITAVGFDLYCQLLKQSVASLKGEKVKPRIDVQVRLDFMSLGPTDDRPTSDNRLEAPSSACIPFTYISDPRQRIEIYRRLAQATEKPSLTELEKELRDRFGPIPSALQLLIQLTELKILAGERAVAAIEVKEQKLMLTRNNDFVMVGNKFPRLNKKQPSALLNEIKKVLLAL
jgi:transcription-repair coupling factor (superfamily II helicase)